MFGIRSCMCIWAARGAADRGRGVVVDPASGSATAGAGRPVGAGRRRSAHTAHGSANQGVRRQLAAVGDRVSGRVGARSAQVGGVGAGALCVSCHSISITLKIDTLTLTSISLSPNFSYSYLTDYDIIHAIICADAAHRSHRRAKRSSTQHNQAAPRPEASKPMRRVRPASLAEHASAARSSSERQQRAQHPAQSAEAAAARTRELIIS
jgi:hypothetical protein